ncbi:MAG: hypothetical protein E7317_05395 [Clostridiales bacterium]|nr:hypothetical protein [Clostridiales bacterium]
MPPKGLSKARLAEHIRKYSPVYIIGVVIMLLLTNIIYTSTRPQVPFENEVLIYLADGYSNVEALNAHAPAYLEFGQGVDASLESVEFDTLMYNDPSQDYTASYLLMTRLALGNADVFLASSKCAEALFMAEAAMPLEDALATGWMKDAGLDPVYAQDEETGERFIGGLSLSGVTGLAEMGAMANDGAVLVVMANGTNTETSMAVIERVILDIQEGVYAPAEG